MDGLRTFTLTDGGQEADAIAAEVIAYLDGARTSLDLALYDLRLPGEVGDRVAAAIKAAAARGVQVRIVFNEVGDGHDRPKFPPPPRTQPHVLETLGVPVRGIPGEPDLMHHKYVVRDGAAVWTGSMNWTVDSWTRQENIVLIAESAGLATAYTKNFEDLWNGGHVAGSGAFDAPWVELGGGRVRAWFSPGRGEALSQAIATALGAARTRIRIASPVLTAGAVLGTLAEIGSESKVDVQGVCDWTQLSHVFDQWAQNPRSSWKAPVLARVLETAHYHGKRSTPYTPDSVHDFMHAKVTVADDTVFAGSFNLSRSGEMNAENVLEIEDAGVADAAAAFIDGVYARYPDVEAPPLG